MMTVFKGIAVLIIHVLQAKTGQCCIVLSRIFTMGTSILEGWHAYTALVALSPYKSGKHEQLSYVLAYSTDFAHINLLSIWNPNTLSGTTPISLRYYVHATGAGSLCYSRANSYTTKSIRNMPIYGCYYWECWEIFPNSICSDSFVAVSRPKPVKSTGKIQSYMYPTLIDLISNTKVHIGYLSLVFTTCVGFYRWTIYIKTYHQISNISHTKYRDLNVFVSSCSCLCAIYWSKVLSQEWRFEQRLQAMLQLHLSSQNFIAY